MMDDSTSVVSNSRVGAFGGGLNGSAVFGDGQSEASTSTERINSPSMTKQINSAASSLIVSLQIETERTGWKWYLGTWIPIMLYLWSSMFLPTLREASKNTTPNQPLSHYIFVSAANFPNTLAGNVWMTREISIAIAAVIFAFVVLSYLVGIVAVWRSDRTTSSSSSRNGLSKMKLLFYIFGVGCQTFGVFFLYIFAGFYDCSLTEVDSQTSEPVLNRYSPPVPCFGAQNLIFFVMSILATLTVILFVVFSRSITQSLNPLSTVPFASTHPFTLTLLDVVNMLGLVILYAVPIEYGYAAHAANCVLSFVFMLFLMYSCPFYRRIENSIMCGVACARLGASVATLVTSVLVQQVGMSIDSSLAIGVPLKFGLILLCGLCAFLGYEIYLKLTVRNVRNRILSELYDLIPADQSTLTTDKKSVKSFMESKALAILQDFNDSDGLRGLSMFFKFATKSNHVTHLDRITNADGIPLSISDKEISLVFVKTVQQHRRFKQVHMLHYLALLIAYDQQHSNVDIALELIQRITTHSSSLLDQIMAQYRIKEIQHKSSSTTHESFSMSNDMKVQRLKYLQDLLLSLHRDFWKELIQEPVKYSTIEKITLKISETTNECNKIFNELLVHRKNKNHLRMYATFVEIFEFDKELAIAIHDEANQLDEEQRVSMSIQKSKKNQVVPRFTKRENSSVSHRFMTENLHSTFSKKMTNPEIFSSQDLMLSKKKDNDDNVELTEDVNFDDSVSVTGGGEGLPASFEQKKETMFRNALKTRVYSESILFGAFLTFILICIAFVIGGIVITVVAVSNIAEDVLYLSHVCLPESSPVSVMKNIRNMQSWIHVWFNNGMNEWPPNYGNFLLLSKMGYINAYFEQFKKDKQFFENLIHISEQNKFDNAAFTEYGQTIYQIKIPTATYVNGSTSGEVMFIGQPIMRNISVNEIANSYSQLIDTVMNQFPKEDMTLLATQNSDNTTLLRNVMNSLLMNPISDYTFSYLFQNMDSNFQTLNTFCKRFVTNSKASTSSLIMNVELYFLVVLGLAILMGLIFFVMLRWNQLQFKRLINTIEKQLTKESIGKIYQGLLNSHKTNVDASLDWTILSKIFKSKISISIVVLLISLLVPLCVGIFYYEANGNASSAQISFVNIGYSANVIAHLQYIGFYMGEMLTFYGQDTNSSSYTFKTSIDSSYLKVAPTLDELQSLLVKEINNLVYYWNDLIFGNVNVENDFPMIGLYPSLDKLIKTGGYNCTQALAQNNMTMANYYRNCIGIQSLMTQYITGVSEVAEKTNRFYLSKQTSALNTTTSTSNFEENDASMFMKHYANYRMNLPLTDKLVVFMNEFVRASSEVKLVMVFSFGVFGVLSFIVLGKVLHSMMKSSADHFQHTRMLLNYIPVELFEKNEVLRNLALYNQFSNPILEKLNASSTKTLSNRDENSFTGICNIMNANVDGSLIINTLGEVELINSPALKMFGKTTTEILGASFFILFAPESQDVIRKVVNSLTEQVTKSSSPSTFHETLEVDACLRSNQSKFPAKINFFTLNSKSENRTIIAVTITDITSLRKQQALLAEEKQHSENLLKNILPDHVATRLKKGETFIAEGLKDITCFFSDMVGFTKISSSMMPTDLVKMLNAIVNGFDELTELYQLEKIKTIGDAYFAVGGINKNCSSDHPERTLRFAQDTFRVIREFNEGKLCGNILDDSNQQQLNIRVGIHTGGVVAGVIGKKKFAYDLWGDTINTASRMESTGVPGRIQISRTTYERVHDMGLEFEERQVEVKGKGIMQSYLLLAEYHMNPIVEPTLESDDNKDQHVEQVMLLRNSTSTTLPALESCNSIKSERKTEENN